MAIREVFVAKSGIVHVHVERDYSSRITVADLFDVQHIENIKNDFCDKKFGKTVRIFFKSRFCSKI